MSAPPAAGRFVSHYGGRNAGASSRPATLPGHGCRGAYIAVVLPKAEDEVSDAAKQEQQEHPECRALTEGLRDTNGDQDHDHDIDKWNQEQHQPPARLAGNFQQKVF